MSQIKRAAARRSCRVDGLYSALPKVRDPYRSTIPEVRHVSAATTLRHVDTGPGDPYARLRGERLAELAWEAGAEEGFMPVSCDIDPIRCNEGLSYGGLLLQGETAGPNPTPRETNQALRPNSRFDVSDEFDGSLESVSRRQAAWM